eukprot:CAMPEP_0202699108 /NCGR_PEP_ID=MMETSP1385-20130828/12325_1 /ASSEMBLY_ACC=CAM_ASM_000861 /TAXON_ID=933848 /ORGANISM="Elphidium margaritaceum" /LENGTH=763 /DNA_ID=CAMNT_0049355969 /DNA_START=85 /DNA_END=2376 /DNA_ORIENTATION=-
MTEEKTGTASATSAGKSETEQDENAEALEAMEQEAEAEAEEVDDDNDDDDDDDDEYESDDVAADKNMLLQLLMSQTMSGGIPILSKLFDTYIMPHCSVSSCSLQGYRDAMEDQHVIQFPLRNRPRCSVFGVFDGHGGDLTSLFLKNTLIVMLEAMDSECMFDDQALIQCMKDIDLKWLQFEERRKELSEKYLHPQQQQQQQPQAQDTDQEETEEQDDEQQEQPAKEEPHQEEQEDEEDEDEEDDTQSAEVQAAMLEEIRREIEQEKDAIIKCMLHKVFLEELHPLTFAPDSEPLIMEPMANDYGTVGSTVCFLICEHNEKDDSYSIIAVNLGDSRAIVLKKNEATETTTTTQARTENKPETETKAAAEHKENDEAACDEKKEDKQVEEEEEEDDDIELKEEAKSKKTPAVVNSPFRLIELTEDHKPDNEEEKNRIIKAGGSVKFGRCDGDLSLSRAIGDTKYKHNDALPVEEQKISCVPSITRCTAHAGDYLLVFCDGIVEYKQNEEVCQFLQRSIQQHISKTLTATSSKAEDDNNGDEDGDGDGGDDEDDIDIAELNGMSICDHLRSSEIDYLNRTSALQLSPKHAIELQGMERVLHELTQWALDSGSKDNMTALLIKLGRTKLHNTVYRRIWCPCEFFRHKVKFNDIDEELQDRSSVTLNRFMRLFETDCGRIGWDMADSYQNALLQKILYANDLITNCQQKRDIKKLIQVQTKKLQRLEEQHPSPLLSVSKRGKKRKKMSQGENEEAAVEELLPWKKRKL